MQRASCQHGRRCEQRRNQCKECGGSSTCQHLQHGRERTVCKECGGASIYQHGRRCSACKECRGGRVASRSVSTGGSAINAKSVEEAASVSTVGCAVNARSVEQLHHVRRHPSATSPTHWTRKRNQTRVSSRRARRMVRWRVLVVAKASGADTDSTIRTGMTTHLQEMVCGTSTARLVITTFVFSLHMVVLLLPVGAVRYCSVCSMSQVVAQHLFGEASYTKRRPIGRLDLRGVCT